MHSNIPTPHITAKKSQIANIVLMSGDPLRAKLAAQKYLKNPLLVNDKRGMLAYTGTYKGKKITIMGHGMGMPSIGIYSYELFKFYDVNYIIRFGTAGAYKKQLNIGDIILSSSCKSYSLYAKDIGASNSKILYPSKYLLSQAELTAKEMKLPVRKSHVFCEDTFYNKYTLAQNIKRSNNADAVEMEAFALYANAMVTKKQALTILTISDSLVTHKAMSAEQRQNSTTKMIELALNTAICLK